MEKEFTLIIRMAILIKDNLTKVLGMEKEYLLGLMETFMKVNT